jgi:hypothetical protein
MYTLVKIALEKRRNVLTMPVQALSTTGLSAVWVVDGHDELRRQAIMTGLQTPDWVEITKGLKIGDRIVFGDRGGLTSGLKVEPKLTAAAGT